MDKSFFENQLREIIDKLVREYKPEKVILFGSWAWGEPHKDSDFDLFIVKDTEEPSLKRIEHVDRIFTRRAVPMDFIVYTPQQVKNRVQIGDSFVRSVLTKGCVLYDAAAAS